MRLYTLVMMIILIGMVTAGLAVFTSQSNTSYNLNLSDTEYSGFKYIDQIANETVKAGQPIYKGNIEDTDTLTTFFKQAVSGGKLIAKTTTFATSIVFEGFNVIGPRLGLPEEFSNGLIAIISVIGVFGLLYAVQKFAF